MKNGLITVVFGASLLLSVGWTCVAVVSWRTNAALAVASEERLARIRAATEELRQWRSRPALISESHTPSQLLLAMIAEAGDRAGIPSPTIKSIEGERDRTVAGASNAFSRQSLRVQIDAVQLPDVGRFIHYWRIANPAWTATNIDLSPALSVRSDTRVKWNCTIVFENVYLSK